MVSTLRKIVRVISKTSSSLIYRGVTCLIPKDNELWVFGSWKGKNFSDNSKELFEYVSINHPEIRAVWISKTKEIEDLVRAKGFRTVNYKTFVGKWIVARAKINVQTESNEDTGTYRVGGACVIQLFHGYGAVKETQLYGNMSSLKKTIVKIYADNHSSSFWMVPSDYYKEKAPFLFEANPNKIRVTGQPRADLILRRKKIPFFENLKKKNRLIGYMPTHRSYAQSNNVYMDDSSWNKLNEFLSRMNYILIFKPHPLELFKYQSSFKEFSNIILVSSETIPDSSDVNEYMHYFDMLISDYSSITSDFLLFNRPIIHYMYDLESFEDQYFHLNAIDKFTAGPIVRTLDELMIQIKDGLVNDTYEGLRKSALKNGYKYIDANNCERVYNEINKILKDEKKN